VVRPWALLTASEDVDSEFDRGEVTAADLIAQLVESDTFTKSYLTKASLVTSQLVRQSLVSRQEPLALRLHKSPFKRFQQRGHGQTVVQSVIAVEAHQSLFVEVVAGLRRL